VRSPVLLVPLALAACLTTSDKTDDTDSDTESDSVPVDTDTAPDTDVETPNSAPSAPEVALGPAHPTSATGLQATVTTASVDPDGDEVTYTWVWRANGVLRDDVTGDTVAPGVAREGETWEVEVVPTDGLRSGPSATASATLENAEPTLEIAWYDEAPNTDVDLHVRVTAVDADLEPLTTTYAWTRDGEETAFGTAVVPAYHTEVGEQWEVTVTVADSDGASASASLSLTVVDRDPVISSLTISPSPASPGAPVTADLVVSDADHDDLLTTWTWRRNGTLAAYTGDTLPPNATVLGDTWSVEVLVNDGNGGSDTATASVQIVDQAPVVDVDILPGDPSPGEALEAVLDAVDPEAEGLVTTWSWKVNGATASGRTTATIPAGVTQDGDVWEVTARVSDGFNPEVVARASIEVIDQPPVVWSAVIDPSQPQDGDDLTVTDVVATDPEGHALTYTYAWTRDGVVVPSLTGTTVPAAQTAPGDTWRVRVTVFDGSKSSATYTSQGVKVR
jgi:hypothetical protein